MRQDIDRIIGVNLDHIDVKLEKTSSTLISLSDILNKKLLNIGKTFGT